MMVIKFESPAEASLYPILNSIALKNKFKFYYQYVFTAVTNWFAEKSENLEYDEAERLQEWADEKGIDTDYELYRADFVLKSSSYNLIIEVDGELYHQNKQYEDARDNYFHRHGYDVLHVPAKDALYHQGKIKDLVISKFKEKGVIM